MKTLLDTNIILDVLIKREGYKESKEILRIAETDKLNVFLTTASIMDIRYILRKEYSTETVKNILTEKIFFIATIIEISKEDVLTAFDSAMTDYEDAVQSNCAKRNNIDYIVTRNIKDFNKSLIPALLPKEFLFKLNASVQ